MKKSLLTGAIVIVLGAAGAGIYSLNKPSSTSVTSTSPTAVEQSAQQATDKITFSDDGKTVSYKGEEGVTALATLESLTTITTKDSDFGKFVTSINGVQADSSKEYWAFYVNDKFANEGAGTYKAKAGDTFKWQLEKL